MQRVNPKIPYFFIFWGEVFVLIIRLYLRCNPHTIPFFSILLQTLVVFRTIIHTVLNVRVFSLVTSKSN